MPKSAYVAVIQPSSDLYTEHGGDPPKFREGYGDGAPVVVCDGESPLHTARITSNDGEGEQVSQISCI